MSVLLENTDGREVGWRRKEGRKEEISSSSKVGRGRRLKLTLDGSPGLEILSTELVTAEEGSVEGEESRSKRQRKCERRRKEAAGGAEGRGTNRRASHWSRASKI